MLQVNLNEIKLDKEGEQHVRKMNRKLEKELGLYPHAGMVFNAYPKSRKQNQVHMQINDETGLIYEQEFATRCWKSALDLCVQHAVWVLKKKSRAHHLSQAATRNYATY